MAKPSQHVLDFERPLVDLEAKIQQIRLDSENSDLDVSQQVEQLEQLVAKRRQEIYANLTPSQVIQVARHPHRPNTLNYIETLCDTWYELHGDRCGNDDAALVGGVGTIDGVPLLLMGHQKGRDTKEKMVRNFGMASPGGYRKALRLMRHGDRFHLPLLMFIDTSGAYAGLKAEEQGQGEAIAANLREMFALRVPIIGCVIGEGGSGGALGIGIVDHLMMFEYSIYTVASPEACAAILWKDAKRSADAAQALQVTARQLRDLGLVDEVIPEPLGGNHALPKQAVAALKEAIFRHLKALQALSPEELLEQRYEKFRRMGRVLETGDDANP
ncbi:MAG: acetyl-CoA carboxylase subunit alpha [Candidatus Synechococcus spongiarum SP3]|uniref:Acetyl-coenzyme A carboxylase carboxyl transferase subunit alpha n=1 Tax=Candidatus Synechococcus spongiarum SP3 TaxID=1604020 RepID=A0A0G2HME3_9SYNE|nr:MAG: acetyl-CoA carboxylase subunit alpha [Candidatus Synechococcus spongiarum SP3]